MAEYSERQRQIDGHAKHDRTPLAERPRVVGRFEFDTRPENRASGHCMAIALFMFNKFVFSAHLPIRNFNFGAAAGGNGSSSIEE
jgi:hypothetical protein